jgi:hypothetical protein
LLHSYIIIQILTQTEAHLNANFFLFLFLAKTNQHLETLDPRLVQLASTKSGLLGKERLAALLRESKRLLEKRGLTGAETGMR